MTPHEPRMQRLAALVAAYGSDPSRWPASDRTPVIPPSDASDALLAEFAQARELDAALESLAQVPAPAPELRRRLLLALAAARRDPAHASSWLQALWDALGGSRLAAPALSFALALGLGLGWWNQSTFDESPRSEDLLVLAQLEEQYAEIDP